MSEWRFGEGSFIVSDEPTGCDDPDNVRAYGGHLVCESVSQVHRNLILAAPDMLAALEAVAEIMPGSLDSIGGGTLIAPTIKIQVIKDAKAAIAKAKGGWKHANPISVIVDGLKIRLKPWELDRTVNGHTLPDGAEWHRQDFTEDMLPAPYRPLMSGEFIHADDEFDYDQTGRFMSYKDWGDEGAPNCIGAPIPNIPGLYHHRTTRTIKPEPQWLPLGPEDVEPLSMIRRKGEGQSWHWRLLSYVHGTHAICADRGYAWSELARDYEINRPRHRDADGNPTLWEECRKGGQMIAHQQVVYELVNSSGDEVYHALGFWLDKTAAIAAASADSPELLGMDADGFAAVEVREHPLGLNPSERYRVVFRRKWAEKWNDEASESEWTITETEVKP